MMPQEQVLKQINDKERSSLLGKEAISINRKIREEKIRDNFNISQEFEDELTRLYTQEARHMATDGVDESKIQKYVDSWKRSIASMKKCGLNNGEWAIKLCYDLCNENHKQIDFKSKCNLRTCPRCSLLRRDRIFKKYYIELVKEKKVKFLTISPDNYSDYDEALSDIKKCWKKFYNAPYTYENTKSGRKRVKERIKDRMSGGFYVVETKTKNLQGEHKGWNVHLHVLYSGDYLDNKIRGKCFDCNQSYLKKDNISKKYYCANRKCNSLNVKPHSEDSKITRIWKKISGRSVNMNIGTKKNSKHCLNYTLKYVSNNKDDFHNDKELAMYVFKTKKVQLITPFGSFYHDEKYKENKRYVCKNTDCDFEVIQKKNPKRCPKCLNELYTRKAPKNCNTCDHEINYFYDREVIHYLNKSNSEDKKSQSDSEVIAFFVETKLNSTFNNKRTVSFIELLEQGFTESDIDSMKTKGDLLEVKNGCFERI